jgi:mannose-6-phosphate isomerase-like protein (cupin superfamily)
MAAYVVDEQNVDAQWENGVESRLTIDGRLQQRVLRFGPGPAVREPGERQELLYVVSGTGVLFLRGEEHPLEADNGILVLPGERYELRGPLLAVSVTAAATGAERERVVSRFADRPEERADEQRTFRVLHQGDLTQFVGIVQPCRAPDHSHPYDEVGFILEGRGFAHVAGDSTAIGPGFCFHLPPNEVHCIENSGPGVMRILGVFYPSGSPKQRG